MLADRLRCFSAEPAHQELGLGDVPDGPGEAPGARSLRPHGPAPALVLHLKGSRAPSRPRPRSRNQDPKTFLVRFNLRSESLKYAAFRGCLELNPVPLGAGLCRGSPHGSQNAAVVVGTLLWMLLGSRCSSSPSRLQPETLQFISGIKNVGAPPQTWNLGGRIRRGGGGW